MKTSRSICLTALIALLTFSGCGKDQKQQAEVVRGFEESFALDPASASSTTYSEGQQIAPRQRSSARDGTSTQQTTQSTGSSSYDQGNSAPEQVSPALRHAAQDVVQFMNSGDYPAAVERLDQLMGVPNLTPDQWIATRNTMVEVQRRIASHPTMSDEEKRRAMAVVNRE